MKQLLGSSRLPLAVAGICLALGGCSSVQQNTGVSGSQASVPHLANDAASLEQWISFARVAQSADQRWRDNLSRALATNDERNIMLKAVANSWSNDPARLNQALRMYQQGLPKVPEKLAPVFMLWRDQASLRLDDVTLKTAYARCQQNGQSQSGAVTRLQQENRDLKHKISELANIEASMDRQRGR